jgi:hypothetical protein
MNFASKDPVYKFIKTFNGEGLISASGETQIFDFSNSSVYLKGQNGREIED